ncbi:UNVERIFIED_CONTAM: hypothetical protein K2H54_000376 [Gekko kuhli]
MSATHPTRLETRTKESNTRASRRLRAKAPRRNEALKMDGAGASGPYPAVAGDAGRGGYAATSRRAAAVGLEA